jgi:hypothetical protein
VKTQNQKSQVGNLYLFFKLEGCKWEISTQSGRYSALLLGAIPVLAVAK